MSRPARRGMARPTTAMPAPCVPFSSVSSPRIRPRPPKPSAARSRFSMGRRIPRRRRRSASGSRASSRARRSRSFRASTIIRSSRTAGLRSSMPSARCWRLSVADALASESFASQALAWYAPFALVLGAFAPFALKRLMTYLHIFQQEEYDGGRFLAWIGSTRTFDRRASLVIAALYALSLVYPSPPILVAAFMAVALVLAAYREADPRKTGKKALAMTQRALRMYRLAFALLMLAGLVLVALSAPPVLVILLVQGVPLALVAAVKLLQRQEDRIQQGFWTEAHEKLKRLQPVVIGVTGSYG